MDDRSLAEQVLRELGHADLLDRLDGLAAGKHQGATVAEEASRALVEIASCCCRLVHPSTRVMCLHGRQGGDDE